MVSHTKSSRAATRRSPRSSGTRSSSSGNSSPNSRSNAISRRRTSPRTKRIYSEHATRGNSDRELINTYFNQPTSLKKLYNGEVNGYLNEKTVDRYVNQVRTLIYDPSGPHPRVRQMQRTLLNKLKNHNMSEGSKEYVHLAIRSIKK